jgi:hypothetical protein
MCFILNDLKCFGSIRPQALKIIFEVQRKNINEKYQEEK